MSVERYTVEDQSAVPMALAERCEAAAGPDRALDRDIMLSAVPCDRAPFRYWVPMNENTGHGAVDVERVYYGPHCAQAVLVPDFTASLDAATTLVPEGWGWLVSQPNAKALASGLLKERTPVLGEVQFGCDHRHTVAAATPALALCAAALRALAASPTPDSHSQDHP